MESRSHDSSLKFNLLRKLNLPELGTGIALKFTLKTNGNYLKCNTTRRWQILLDRKIYDYIVLSTDKLVLLEIVYESANISLKVKAT